MPEERNDALQLLIEAREVEPDSASDRFLAYHGRPAHARWIEARVDAVRWADAVLDGAELDLRNALHSTEPALLRELNADRDRLAVLSGHPRSVEPVAVGVDQDGIDIRTRAGLVRIRFESAPESEGDAAELVRRLLDRDAP